MVGMRITIGLIGMLKDYNFNMINKIIVKFIIATHCFLIAGCDVNENTETHFSSDAGIQNSSVSESEKKILWNVFTKFHNTVNDAKDIEGIKPVLSPDALIQLGSLSAFEQDLIFNLFKDTENSSVHLLDAYILDDEAFLYVNYEMIPGEIGGGVNTVKLKNVNGSWYWSSISVNSNDLVQSLWNQDELDTIQTTISGYITYRDITLPLKSAIGFIDRRERNITFVLYPNPLDMKSIKEHRDGIYASGMFDLPSPDISLWPSWSPLALLSLDYDKDTKNYDVESANLGCINLNWIEERNTFNFICDQSIIDSVSSFILPNEKNSVITIHAAGTAFNGEYSWDLSGDINLLEVNHVEVNSLVKDYLGGYKI